VGYRDLIRRANLVLTVTRSPVYPSGQSVLLESYACGRPVVMTRTIANSSYLDAAIPCEVGNPSDVASAVAALFKDDDTQRELGAAARKLAVKCYDSRRMWEQIATLL
jgi:glycosyltransferase involved in cell wall biosynthesis